MTHHIPFFSRAWRLLCLCLLLLIGCTSKIDEALVIAAADGCKDTVEALIYKGADIESYALDGLTPLMAAAQNGHLTVVQLLIEKGAKPNAIPDGNCCTPLSFAASYGQLETVKYLLAHGGRLNARPESIATLMRIIRANGYVEIEQLIQKQLLIESNK